MSDKQFTVRVTDAPFCAKGDGITNDRASIQAAIDCVAANGGGTVILDAGKVYLSGNLFLKSYVELHFEDGATLLQSSEADDYVKPVDTGYALCRPQYGHNLYSHIKWSHLWYYNYPLLFAEPGTHDFKISGYGIVKMMPDDVPEKILKVCPIGFYRVHHFEISDITITNYHSYAMMPFTSDHGVIRNVTVEKWSHGNGDGICLMNCQHIRITGCKMHTGDDSVYIFSSYKDPRGGGWWSSEEPQASLDIEVDHCDLKSNHCKAFGMILWGIDCPDQSKVEVRNVYVHDNHFQTLGNWNYNPYTTKIGYPPVTNVRFENNVIDAIEPNFFETQITDMNYFHSTSFFKNGDFADGLCFWSYRPSSDAITVGKTVFGEDEKNYACIETVADKKNTLYQGLYVRKEAPCCFWAKVKTDGGKWQMFVRDLETQELVCTKEFCNTEWDDLQMDFTVPVSANYHIGIECVDGEQGSACITNATLLGNNEAAFGYARVGTDPQRNWKPLYFYDPDLWKEE